MNKFTVEEINFMCVFETQNRMKMMEEIRRIMPYIKDSDMEDLSRQVLRKLDGMTDKEFAENSLEAVEEKRYRVGSQLQWLATCLFNLANF